MSEMRDEQRDDHGQYEADQADAYAQSSDETALRNKLIKRSAIAASVLVVLAIGIFVLGQDSKEEPAQESKQEAKPEVADEKAPPPQAVQAQDVQVETTDKADDAAQAKEGEHAKPDGEAVVESELTEKSELKRDPHDTEAPGAVSPRSAIKQKAQATPAQPSPPQLIIRNTTQPAVAPSKATVPVQPPVIVPKAIAPTGPVKGFVVQMGVFANVGNAQQLHEKLVKAGIPAQIEARVQIGPFTSREQADLARSKMREMGLDAGVVVPLPAK